MDDKKILNEEELTKVSGGSVIQQKSGEQMPVNCKEPKEAQRSENCTGMYEQ